MNPSAFDFSVVLQRFAPHVRAAAVNAVVAAVAIYGLTFLMPSWYRSVAVLLPPEETDQMSSGLSVQRFLSHMPTLGMLPNYYTPADIHRAILMSRTVQEEVIRRFDLMKVYHQKSMENAVLEFRHHVSATLNPDGTISVMAEDRSQDRAAAVANSLVQELDRFNVERRNVQARRTRLFFARRAAEADSLARVSEHALKTYQETHRVVVPIEAEASAAEPLADLMSREMGLEVRLQLIRSYLSESSPEVIQVRSELEQLRAQLTRMPGVQNELGRLVRDVRLYQQLYTLLSAQLEDARLRETLNTPTITVLDPAYPTEKRVRPRRIVWAAAGALAAGLVTLLMRERVSLAYDRPRRLDADPRAM